MRAVLLLALSACGASALQRSSAGPGGRTKSAGAPALQRARRLARSGSGSVNGHGHGKGARMATRMSAASGAGMSKEEVDAYIAKVKADTDKVARTRGEGVAGGVVVGEGGVDFGSLVKYPVATALELGIIAALFKGLDVLGGAVGGLPAVFVPPLFAFLSLRSRVFSLLSAKRPVSGGGTPYTHPMPPHATPCQRTPRRSHANALPATTKSRSPSPSPSSSPSPSRTAPRPL